MKNKAAKKKAPAKAKPKAKAKLSIVNTKMLQEIRKALQSKANRHSSGNLSAWLRHAGLRYVPKKGEVVKLDWK